MVRRAAFDLPGEPGPSVRRPPEPSTWARRTALKQPAQHARGLRGASLPPGGYLVLARDVERFKRKHADVASVLDASFEFNLSAKGEMVSLYDAGGRLVDFVEYDDGEGWPSSADGEGFSLELISPVGMDRNEPFSWAPSEEVGGTPGRANGARVE